MSNEKVILASERFGSVVDIGSGLEHAAEEEVGGSQRANPKSVSDELLNSIDADVGLNSRQREKLKQIAQGMEEAWGKHVAPPGTFGLPPLLEARRLEYGIVDQAFEQEALFDRIYVWQIPRTGGDTYEGTMIVRPEQGKRREENETPRGIIISAGLKGMDNLRSNGVDLGHIVNFIRASPWRMPIGTINGVEIPPLMVMRDGDLVSSDDLATARRKGKVKTVVVEVNGGLEHRLQNADGTSTAVSMPWMSEDY